MKGWKLLGVGLVVLSGSTAATQVVEPPRQCPNPAGLHGICTMVGSGVKDPTPRSNFEYLYERVIYDAACADYDGDSDTQIASKISALLRAAKPRLICEGADFDVVEGNIFKYAVNGRRFGLIDKAIDEWDADLNWIDPYDNTTLLDYVQRQIDKNRGSIFEQTLVNYYNKIRRHGGRHRVELP